MKTVENTEGISNSEEKVRVSIVLPKPLHDFAAAEAERDDRSLNKVINRLIQKAMDADKAEEVAS